MTMHKEKNNLPFSKKEYVSRLKKIKKAMDLKKIEVLLDSDPANIYYTTGYDAVSYYTPQIMIISIYHSEPILLVRDQDVLAVRIRTELHDDNIHGWKDIFVDNETSHPFEKAIELIKELELQQCQIGIEIDAGMTTFNDINFLTKNLAKKTIECRRLINFVRMIKSDNEIKYMRQAGKITESAMQAGFNAMSEGVRESDVIANIYHSFLAGTDKYGGDYPSNPPVMPTGYKSATPHLTWSDEPLMNEQNLTLELSGARYRYHCPLARTVYIGKQPPKDLVDATKYAIEGMQETLEAIAPGMTLSEVHSVWEKINKKWNLGKTSRLGYSVGCSFPPSWLERTASIRAEDETTLEPNMTFHLIAGIWKNKWGAEVSETFQVTKLGASLLCNFKQEIHHIKK